MDGVGNNDNFGNTFLVADLINAASDGK